VQSDFSHAIASSKIKRAQGGFSLIEVLVTMLVLAFGLLGVAGLMLGGVSNAANSESRSKASMLAADMADRMRANPAEARTSGSPKYVRLTYDAALPTASTTATIDMISWVDAISKQLPEGGGRIIQTVLTANGVNIYKYAIEIRWSGCSGTLDDTARANCAAGNAHWESFTMDVRV
jgi:type IV pilus assembly protein PilV